jgi:intracellular multiplication protein IcmL
MAGDELEIVRLKDNFYRDGDYKIFIALAFVLIFVSALIATSVYLHMQKPKPVYFTTDNEWRLYPPVSLDLAYLSDADVLQWLSEVVPQAFTYDFMYYDRELEAVKPVFSNDAWGQMTALLNKYVNKITLQNTRGLTNTVVSGAPIILNKGIPNAGKLSGRYVWQVQMPVNINYSSGEKITKVPVNFTMLITRISTLDNLSGIAIDDISVSTGEGGVVPTNG